MSPEGGQYEQGKQINVTATPASGYRFISWSGDASGTSLTFTITMDSDKTLVAYFSQEREEITQPLYYRELDSFTTEAVKDVRGHAAMRGYDLPAKIVEWPYFAVYIVVQNLDDIPGTFEVHYTLTTADKLAAEKQKMLIQRTPEEYAELKREYYEGSIKLYLEPGKAGVAICPPDGMYISPDRVPFDHEHKITPSTKTILK